MFATSINEFFNCHAHWSNMKYVSHSLVDFSAMMPEGSTEMSYDSWPSYWRCPQSWYSLLNNQRKLELLLLVLLVLFDCLFIRLDAESKVCVTCWRGIRTRMKGLSASRGWRYIEGRRERTRAMKCPRLRVCECNPHSVSILPLRHSTTPEAPVALWNFFDHWTLAEGRT